MSTQTRLDMERNARARAAAQRAVEGMQSQPTASVEYRSRGRVLVIGGEEALLFAPRLLPTLHPQVIVLDDSDEPSVPAIPLAGRRLRVSGYLGAFRVELGQPGQRDHEVIDSDLVVDLSAEPLLDMALKPAGYFHSDIEPMTLDALALELPEFIGTFEKPKYFDYDPARCAHGRNGITGCTRCIDACPAEAITALAERIEVNPWLCQGGGVCAAVCPSGAIGYAYPRASDLQERVRRLIQVYLEEGGSDPVLAVIGETNEQVPDADAPNLLWLPVEEVASIGLEIWLAALAYGAHAVWLLDDGNIPVGVVEAIDGQLQTASALLKSLGYPSEPVQRIDADNIPSDHEPMPIIAHAGFSATGSKRQKAFLAIDHLHAEAPHPVPLVDLPVGAPFGAAEIDSGRCTLCLACAGACPGGALSAGGETLGVQFVEENCLQCGLCTRTCPEDAIWITPRLMFDPDVRRRPRSLYEEQPFECVSCGKPFASRRIIETMFERLKENPMYQTSQARRRLMMCEDCRVIDVVQDEQSLAGGWLRGDDHA